MSEAAVETPDVGLVDLNDTDAVVNATGTRIPSTPEGMAIAYSSLVIMALIPIFFGAFRSVCPSS
jgi:minor histocompatibility antigen H13